MFPSHDQRLLEEREQLNEKVTKLLEFMSTDAFTKIDEKQQRLLEEQHPLMSGYLSVLDERIALLG